MLAYSLTPNYEVKLKMQSVSRCGLRAIRAIKPSFSGEKANSVALQNVSALHTSRKLILGRVITKYKHISIVKLI